ncbi:MAG: TetR/AcrR family transcriptional regulator [Gammaproteobacteria bacterium]|nr:TetR/AcrR family transcriptional regulator [Gammaproteobacteria bacterium]
MARRTDHSPEQLKQLTIDAVIQFMAQQPINQLSLRALAKTIGYSPGTLINLFNSYNNLLLQVSGFTLSQIGQQLSAALTNAPLDTKQPTASSHIVAIAKCYLHYAQQTPYQWQQVFEHRLDPDQQMPASHQQQITELFQLLEPLLAQLAPQASSIEITVASRTLWASVHGICVMSIEDKLFTPVTITSEDLIDSLVTNYLTNWVSQTRLAHR